MVKPGVKKAILQTLKYSAHYHYPLTLRELHLRLVALKIPRPQLALALRSLVQSGTLAHTKPYYYLPDTSSDLTRRRVFARLSHPLLAHARSLVPVLCRFPSVLAIFLTGSLAMHNTDGHDDIDLMIVTRPGKLWTTRLLLTIYTSVLGLRRTPNSKNIMGKLCLNLYLTTASLAIPASKRSLYTAYELIQAKPLYDPNHIQALLLSSNSWLSTYLPNFPLPKHPTSAPRLPSLLLHERLLESLAYRLQRAYMSRRLTREYITPDAAFFHPNNPAPTV